MNIWRNIAILRYAGLRWRQNISTYLQAEVAAMEVARWFLTRMQSLGGETPAFPFPHSFVHGAANRLSSSPVQNIQHWRERRLWDVVNCPRLAWSGKALSIMRDRLRTVTADRDTRFDSGQADCGDRNGIEPACRHGARCKKFFPLIPCVGLSVFLSVSAALDDKNWFIFKWLWY